MEFVRKEYRSICLLSQANMTNQKEVLQDSRYVTLYEHGFVGLLDTMGSDGDICQAARVSYGAGTKSVSDNRGLIRYLVRHKHTSPLEMAEVKFHIKLPIFVMRQLIRHRTANLNEYSARYSILSNEFYIPDNDAIAPQSSNNKQGRAGDLTDGLKQEVKNLMYKAMESAHGAYQTLLGETPMSTDSSVGMFEGIARELARIVIPVSVYTECYWKCDLHNFFHFARLRMDSHAQKEIRDYANVMYNLVKPYFPFAAEAFEDYILNSRTLSRMDILVLQDMLAGKFVSDPDHYGMSKREYKELVELFVPTEEHSRNI